VLPMIVIKEISLIAAKVVLVFCVTYMAKKRDQTTLTCNSPNKNGRTEHISRAVVRNMYGII